MTFGSWISRKAEVGCCELISRFPVRQPAPPVSSDKVSKSREITKNHEESPKGHKESQKYYEESQKYYEESHKNYKKSKKNQEALEGAKYLAFS